MNDEIAEPQRDGRWPIGPEALGDRYRTASDARWGPGAEAVDLVIKKPPSLAERKASVIRVLGHELIPKRAKPKASVRKIAGLLAGISRSRRKTGRSARGIQLSPGRPVKTH